MTSPNQKLLSLKDVADRLGLQWQSLRRRISSGKIGTLPIFQIVMAPAPGGVAMRLIWMSGSNPEKAGKGV